MYVGEYHQNKKHGHGSFFWFSLHENTAVNRMNKQVIEQYEGAWWGGLPDGKGQYEKANGKNLVTQETVIWGSSKMASNMEREPNSTKMEIATRAST